MTITSTNPATGQLIKEFEELSGDQIEKKLAAASLAFDSFRKSSFSMRAQWLMRTADLLESSSQRLGEVITLEMGKPIKASIAEVLKCAAVCRYYAEHGQGFLLDETVATSARQSFIRYEPLGVVLAVMPWNFPFWQVFRFAAPTLMAGNVALLKHASNVPQCALAIEEVFRDAGLPAAVFQTLLIGSEPVARLLQDRRIKAATLTGSEAAGRSLAENAGKALKKVVLELGGSDPFIVMPSANLEMAVETAIKARTVNSGQSCIAAKRFIILEEIADEFLASFVSGMNALRTGDPMDEANQLGPLATPQILKDIDQQVRDSVSAGARILTGGHVMAGPGNYYEPTVLSEIPESAPAWGDEIFGPVASVFRAESIDDAIRLANATQFGLGASVWTNDEEEQRRFIDELESGQVFVNAMVASDPRMPFGGVKNSGYGRELGVAGIREFVNTKTVWIGGKEKAGKTE